MFNTIFIVWRESVEAMLVIGILYGWIVQQITDTSIDRKTGYYFLRWLWGGVIAGIGLAVLFALMIMGMYSLGNDLLVEALQALMPLIATLLIVQMVCWMRLQGRYLKKMLETELVQIRQKAHGLGIAILAMTAVGREGAETVIFLYGSALHQPVLQLVLGAAIGFLAAYLFYWLLSHGTRWLSWRWFFRITEILLLLLGGALLVEGIDRMIGLEWLPIGIDPLWNTEHWLNDQSRVGNIIGAFTGYRAMPAGTTYGLLLLYWVIVGAMLIMTRPKTASLSKKI